VEYKSQIFSKIKMGKIKTIFFLLFFLAISTLNHAQNGLDAEIISGDINVCSSGSTEATIKIQFQGETPFFYKLKITDQDGSRTIINQVRNTDVDADNTLTTTVVLTKEVPAGESSTSSVIIVSEMSIDETTWVETTDPGITFTNWAMPAPNAGTNIDSCGLTATLDASPDPLSTNYYWETSVEGELSDPININSTYSVTGTGTYQLTFTQENGVCLAQDNVEVIFRGSPSASISTTSEVCGATSQEATINLTFEGTDSPWSFTITDNNNNPITGTSSTTSHTVPVSVQGETTYSLFRIEDNNGCMALPEGLTGNAVVTDLLPETNAGQDALICGLSTELAAIPDQGTGMWSSSAPQVTISTPSDPNSQISVSGQGNYTLTWTENINGCENSDQVEIQFKAFPEISFSESETHICEGDETGFPFSIAGDNGPWTLDYTIKENAQSETIEESSATLAFSPATTTDIHLTTITDNFGCSSELTDGLTVLVDKMPTPIAGNDFAVCGLETSLNAEMSSAAQYGEWQFPSSGIDTNPKATYKSTNWGSVTLTWVETNGLCTASDELLVRFDEPPIADAGEDFTIYNQSQTIVRARHPVASTDNWTGEWYISEGSGSISNPTEKDATLTQLTHGTTELEWKVTNGVCPPVSDQLVLTVKGLTYYTGISPTPRDGLNDFFSIKGAHTIPQNELIVFDQNGKVVYRASNLEENNQWEGTDSGGAPLENGIYYFIFKGNGIDPVKDYIVIKRN
jgi:gliding motility-associated-like protein